MVLIQLLALGVVAVLFLGFLGLLIAFTRSPAQRLASAPAPAPLPAAGRVPAIEGADEEEVTAMTLAVSSSRPLLRRVSGPSPSTETFFLSPTAATRIGRSRDNDIVLSEDAASSSHCRIEKQGDSWVLTDLGSTNKTWVNGVEKTQVVLRNGDEIRAGETTLVFAMFGDRA